MKFLKFYSFYTLSCFFLGQLCYWIVRFIEFEYLFTASPMISFGTFGSQPYGSFYRMPSYHWDHPLAFWWIMCVSFGLVGTGWKTLTQKSRRWVRVSMGISVIPISVLLASIPASMLWAYYDVESGRFHGFEGTFTYMINQVPTGLQLSLPLFIISIPFNILTTGFALFILFARSPLKKLNLE